MTNYFNKLDTNANNNTRTIKDTIRNSLEYVLPKDVIDHILVGYIFEAKLIWNFEIENENLGGTTFSMVLLNKKIYIKFKTNYYTLDIIVYEIDVSTLSFFTENRRDHNDRKFGFCNYIKNKNDIYVFRQQFGTHIVFENLNKTDTLSLPYHNHIDILTTIFESFVFFVQEPYVKIMKITEVGSKPDVVCQCQSDKTNLLAINNNNELLVITRKKFMLYDPKTLEKKVRKNIFAVFWQRARIQIMFLFCAKK